jgi:hypothetical protein
MLKRDNLKEQPGLLVCTSNLSDAGDVDRRITIQGLPGKKV